MLAPEQIQKIPFRGSSMDPILQNAEAVWIDFSKVERPKVGEVIVYQENKREFICHRLIGVTGDAFIVKGDNSLCFERLPRGAHWGRVVAFEKNGETHRLKNHVLFGPYCWLQMHFQKTNSNLARRLARKLGLVYLSFVKRLIAQ
jgi:signal peptidase I